MDFNSILEKVKPQIPTIDSDFSSPGTDETDVYQRPAGVSLEIPEDFEDLMKPGTCWSEEMCRHPDDDETAENNSATQRCDAEVEAGACETEDGAGQDAPLRPNMDDTKSNNNEGFPVLSFARLDQWDLDDVLQKLKVTRLSLRHCVSVEPVETQTDCNKNLSEGDVMQRLAALSEPEPVKGPDCNTVRSRSPERPTVCADPRCPDASAKPAVAVHSGHRETLPVKKHKVHVGPGEGGREVTGKSVLLQQIRNNKYPEKCTGHPGGREVIGQPAESVCGRHMCGDKQSSPVQPRKNKKESSVKKQRQQSDQERWFRQQLEKHRPTRSVHLKQAAAEKTDVLYESEASQLQPVSTLPTDVESRACLLLVVNLSSPGEVEAISKKVLEERSRRNRKHLYASATRSHIYNTLVAWFLSLAGPDSCHREAGAKVPFWVAGLQQLWTGHGLALHVLVVARHCYKPKKRDVDVRTSFYNHVCRFLSVTSLPVIASWLPELTDLLDQQPCASPVHLPPFTLSCYISACSSAEALGRTFGAGPGFYWQTVETEGRVLKGRETTQELHTEVSVVLGSSGFLQDPLLTHYTLQLVLDSGLDVCGLRLLYPPPGLWSESVGGGGGVDQRGDEPRRPVLALAVRGPHAHSLLKDSIGSLDPLLQRTSISPPPLSRVHRELCVWFSGRLPGESSQNPNEHPSRVTRVDDRFRESLFDLSRSSSLLCATTKADLLLVVSPVVPPRCYGRVLAVCERRGFGLRGLQRMQLHSDGAAVLGLSGHQTAVFCDPAGAVQDPELELTSHCLVLLLRKENASHHSVNLPSALMREFKEEKLLGHIGSRCEEPGLCFHTVLYNRNLFHVFVRLMWALPDPSRVILCRERFSSGPDLKQVVVLTVCGKDVSGGLQLLHRALAGGAEGDGQQAGLELLGLKWLPMLTRYQAQELSPYEVGSPLCYGSVDALMSSPALVCALRGFDAFASLRKLLPLDYPHSPSVLMSSTPEVAFRQAALFFFDQEMNPDGRMLLKPRLWDHSVVKTLSRLQRGGPAAVGVRVVTPDRSDAASPLPPEGVKQLISGPSLALCLRGDDTVKRLLDVLSLEDPSPWMTRYGSGTRQQAIQDVKRFFPDGLCCTPTRTTTQEQILSLCSDPFASVEPEHSCRLTHQSLSEAEKQTTLWQTTCLLIPLNAPPAPPAPPAPHSQMSSQLELVEQLLGSGCHLVAGRMSTLDAEQRTHVAGTLSPSGREKMADFPPAPCLIMALRGEKIVTGFSLILESVYKERSELEQVGKMIIYPESEKEAEQLMFYLFDASSPGS